MKFKHQQLIRCFSLEANTTTSTIARNTQQPPTPHQHQQHEQQLPQHPSLEELFPRQDILNAWGPDLAPLDDTFLDRSTRYIVHLLTAQRLNLIMPMTNDGTDDPYAYGTTGSSGNGGGGGGGAAAAATNVMLDRATTERCNRAIENLILANTVSEGKATRADEILRAMQAFYPLAMTTSMSTTAAATTGSSRNTDSTTTIPTTTAAATTAATTTIPLSSSLPLPTADTYFMVLRLFASDPTSCPERATAIVETMQQRYVEYGQLDHQPNVVHWNQVLSCWAVSATRDEKAFEAANLLQKLQSLAKPQFQAHSQSYVIHLDTSSYAHVLRACAKSDWSPKSRLLGAKVALRVYSEFRKRVLEQQQQQQEGQEGESLPEPQPQQQQHSLKPTTYVYTYYFQAIANLSPGIGGGGGTGGNSTQQQQLQQQRDDAAVAAYQDAVYHGCVNEYVLDNFRQALHNNMEIFRSTVGEHCFGAHYTTTAQLLSRLPTRAKRNNGKSSTSTSATTKSSTSNNKAKES